MITYGRFPEEICCGGDGAASRLSQIQDNPTEVNRIPLDLHQCHRDENPAISVRRLLGLPLVESLTKELSLTSCSGLGQIQANTVSGELNLKGMASFDGVYTPDSL